MTYTQEKIKVAFVAHTPFQIMNCINYAINQIEYKYVESDIYIVKGFFGFEEIVRNLKKEKIFSDIYACDSKKIDECCVVKQKIERVNFIAFPQRYLENLTGEKRVFRDKEYNYIFTSILSRCAMAIIMAYPKARLFFYDDGLSSYIGSIGSSALTLKRRFFFALTGHKVSRFKPEAMYVYNSKLCKTQSTECIRELPSFADASPQFLDKLYRIFSFFPDSGDVSSR